MAYRYFAVDFGEKRIGLAVSDALGITAQALETFVRTGNALRDAEYVRNYARRYAPCRIVFGMPRLMNGSFGHSAERVASFAKLVLDGWEGESDFFDERFTSVIAERAMSTAELRPKERRKIVDRIAAQIILQGYLELHPIPRPEAHLAFGNESEAPGKFYDKQNKIYGESDKPDYTDNSPDDELEIRGDEFSEFNE